MEYKRSCAINRAFDFDKQLLAAVLARKWADDRRCSSAPQPVEREALNLVVAGSSPVVGFFRCF